MVAWSLGIADRSDGVQIEGLYGLEPGVTAAGTSTRGTGCSETPAGLTSGAVGGHYYDGCSTNRPVDAVKHELQLRWERRRTHQQDDAERRRRPLWASAAVYGRTVVVHESNSAVKPACGVIGVGATRSEAVMPSMVKYVGYAGGQTVNGMLKFSSNSP